MASFKIYLISISTLIIAIALLLWGFFAVFQTQKLTNFTIESMSRKNSSNFLVELAKRISKTKLSYYNTKIVGVIAILMALLFIFASINALIKMN
jgi:hypothetical protein